MSQEDVPADPFAAVTGLAGFFDDELFGVPAGFARRDIQQQSLEQGQATAGRRAKALMETLDTIEYEASRHDVDRVVQAFIDAGWEDEIVKQTGDRILNHSFSQAPKMNAGNSPPLPEAAVNGINIGALFAAADILGHGFFQPKQETPAYYGGKFAYVGLAMIANQIYWGREALTDDELQWWSARAASLLTVEYYTLWVPTIESAEPWTAPLWNEEASRVAGLGPLPVSEDPVTTVFFGLGHMAALKRILEGYPPAPPLPHLDIPLPGPGYAPRFGP